jgi:hypothetical protein
MSSEKQKLNTVMRLGVELTEVKDVEVLMERILLEDQGFQQCWRKERYFQAGLNPEPYRQNTECFQLICPVNQLLT